MTVAVLLFGKSLQNIILKTISIEQFWFAMKALRQNRKLLNNHWRKSGEKLCQKLDVKWLDSRIFGMISHERNSTISRITKQNAFKTLLVQRDNPQFFIQLSWSTVMCRCLKTAYNQIVGSSISNMPLCRYAAMQCQRIERSVLLAFRPADERCCTLVL